MTLAEVMAGLLALVKAWVVVSFGEVGAINQCPCAFISPHNPSLNINMSFKRRFFLSLLNSLPVDIVDRFGNH